MMSLLWTVIVLQVIVSGGCVRHHRHDSSKPREKCGTSEGPGEPLFLTPLLERGDIVLARRMARVPLFDDLQIESYAGFFTVNKTYDSHHYFWYFPSMSANRANDPVIVWLNGGPGAPSAPVAFINGPVTQLNGKFVRKKIHWTSNNHMIYIDNPVGTGFSFTKHPDGYCTDQTQVGEQLYSTVTQFFHMFPELRQNKFFVDGTSYGGKYAPTLAYTIHKKNPSAEIKINLKGLSIANGLSDPEHQLIYSQYLYQIGLIDNIARNRFEDYEAKALNYIKNHQWKNALDTYGELLLFPPNTYFGNVTGFNAYFHYLYPNGSANNDPFMDVKVIFENNATRKAIHVGDLKNNMGSHLVLEYLKGDFMQSVAPWVSELLDNYYCCVYTGQLDIVVPYPQVVNYLQHLNFSGSEEYKTAERSTWRVNGEIAGYTRRAGKLIEVLVRNAGHVVIIDQPEWAYDLINRFTHSSNHWDD